VDRPWLAQYPAGVPAQIDVDACASLGDMLAATCTRFAERLAKTNSGKILRRELRDAAPAKAASAAPVEPA
jgi:long-chain acyl-CoA synthetase